MDAHGGHQAGGLVEDASPLDRPGRTGHQVADDEAVPAGPRDRRSLETDEVGRADDADEVVAPVDDREAADLVAGEQFGDAGDGLIFGR